MSKNEITTKMQCKFFKTPLVQLIIISNHKNFSNFFLPKIEGNLRFTLQGKITSKLISHFHSVVDINKLISQFQLVCSLLKNI